MSDAQAKPNNERVEENKLRQEIAQLEDPHQREKQPLEAARRSAPTQAVPPASLQAMPAQDKPAQRPALPPL